MPQRGDFILSYENTFFSWFIRWTTKSRWSHVGVCVNDYEFISAVPGKGVCVQLNNSIPEKQRAFYALNDVTSLQRNGIAGFCENKFGKPYDYLQVLLIGWRLLTKNTQKNSGDPNENAFECAELVSEACASQGIQITKYIDNASPETIAASPLVHLVN